MCVCVCVCARARMCVGWCVSACILVCVDNRLCGFHSHPCMRSKTSSAKPPQHTHTRKQKVPSSIGCRPMLMENFGFLFLTASLFTIVSNAVVLNGFKRRFESCEKKLECHPIIFHMRVAYVLAYIQKYWSSFTDSCVSLKFSYFHARIYICCHKIKVKPFYKFTLIILLDLPQNHRQKQLVPVGGI